jgi:hypothetical protein
MSDPKDHSRSGFEAGGEGAPRGGAGAEAQRFWGEYARRTRHGSQRAERGPEQEAGNGGGEIPQAHECLEWCPICRTADILRASTPPEVRDQLHSVQRDALVAVRALLDAYLERSGDGPARRSQSAVEDIPIE